MSEAMGGSDSPRPRQSGEPAGSGTGGPPATDPYAQPSMTPEPYASPAAPADLTGSTAPGYPAPGGASTGYPGLGAPAGRPGGEPPGSVKTAAILLYIAAAFAILGGVIFLVAASLSGLLIIVSLVLLAIGVAYIVLAGKLKQGNRTARLITVVLTGLSLLANLAQIGRAPLSAIIGIALNGAIIYLLMLHRDSKRFFGDPV